MAEELQYTVKFKTTSEGSGAKQTADGINGVTEAQKRHNKAQAEGKQGREEVLRAMSNTTDQARVSEFAFYDLDAAQTRTANTSEKAGNNLQTAGEKSKMAGQNMLQAAYAADDLQYGLRGIVNNVPMLAQAFGLSASWAGGIAILAVALNQLMPLISQAFGGMEQLKETSGDMLTNAANAALNKLDKRKAELEDSVKKLKVESTPDAAGDEAKQKALDAYASQLKTITTVSEQLNQLLGRQTTALEQMAAQAAADAAAREAATQAALAAEEKKVESARTALKIAEAEREAKAIARQDAQLAAEMADKEVKRLQERRDLLAQTAAERVGWAQALGDGSVLPGQKTGAAEAATVDLENTNAELDAAAVAANNIHSAAEKMTTVLSRYDDVIAGAAQALERQQAASAQNVETIMQQQGVQAAADTATGLQAATSETAQKLSSALGLVKDQQGVAQEAVTQMKTLLEGGLTTEELKKLPGLITQLLGTYKGDLSQVVGTLENVKDTSGILASRIEKADREILEIKRSLSNRGTGTP
jgi:hypothetical protein